MKYASTFWVTVFRNSRSQCCTTIQAEIDELCTRMHKIGAPIMEYQVSGNAIRLRLPKPHRVAVKAVLVQALIDRAFHRCHVGPQTLGRDENGRPFIEHLGYMRRRYLDWAQSVGRLITANPTPGTDNAKPYVIPGTDVVQ